MLLNRRTFCARTASFAASAALSRGSLGQSSRPDVRLIDHDRVLSQARRYVSFAPDPITSYKSQNNPGTPNDFFSEDDGSWPDDPRQAPATDERTRLKQPTLFTSHRNAMIKLSLVVPALAAACLLLQDHQTPESKTFGSKAASHLRAWFVDPGTRMAPNLQYGLIDPKKPSTPRSEGLIEAIQLVEIARSIPILLSYGFLSESEATSIFSWFETYLDWLRKSALAGLARDQRDHNATSWLLQASAFTTLLDTGRKSAAEKLAADQLSELRHYYKSVTVRSQIIPDGRFLNELTSPWPYRLSLFNLDMLAGICLLLSTRFESVWDFDLQDGPGMRVAMAYHYPFLSDRASWPYPADASRFNELPLRHPALLFAARAYERPEYASLWKTLQPDPKDSVLLRTYPIRQPLLWTTRRAQVVQ